LGFQDHAAAHSMCATGQPTPDFFGGLKRLARATALRGSGKPRALELPASEGSMVSPGESAGSSSAGSGSRGSSGVRGQEGQTVMKENAQPWR
jgi:hypothetical protein